MFSKFDIEYLNGGEWHPIENKDRGIAEHPAYNYCTFTPVKAEGIRFINKEAEDLERHIYKIGVHELWKESYNFRAVRRADKAVSVCRRQGSWELWIYATLHPASDSVRRAALGL